MVFYLPATTPKRVYPQLVFFIDLIGENDDKPLDLEVSNIFRQPPGG